jgi:hypothetical protein
VFVLGVLGGWGADDQGRELGAHRTSDSWIDRRLIMKRIVIAGLCVVLGFLAVLAIVHLSAGPPAVQIIAPEADVNPALAALFGDWNAPSPEGVISRVVVERIRPRWAGVLVFWSERIARDPTANWQRVKARVLPSGALEWGYPVHYTLTLQDGAAQLELHREMFGQQRPERVVSVPLQKTDALVVKAP